MLFYWLKCSRNSESKNPKFVRTRKRRIMLLSKCSVCNSKKLKFLKEQEVRGLLSSLQIRTPLSRIPLSGLLLFQKTMLSYWLKCSRNAENKNPKFVRTKKRRIMLLSKCSVCNGKKLKFLKEEEVRGLLSSLQIRTPLSRIPLSGLLLFQKA